MPALYDASYSEAETIAAVRNYCRFLSRIYLDTSDILEPREGGWPMAEVPDAFDKTEQVRSLLRQLSCLRGGKHAGPNVESLNWNATLPSARDCDYYQLKCFKDGHIFEQNVPPHCIRLKVAAAHNMCLILDTKLGIIYLMCDWEDPSMNASTELILRDAESYTPEEEE
ncbi:Hypothetical protein D9617_5g067660 [Elsinoe fawcettii]|nr:Hypothetical protein D9617_5g067660 [Elsinoe fawcettii]